MGIYQMYTGAKVMEYSYWVYRTSTPQDKWVYKHKDTEGLPIISQQPYGRGSLGSGSVWEGALNSSALTFDDVSSSGILTITSEGNIVIAGTGVAMSFMYRGSRFLKTAHHWLHTPMMTTATGLH